MALIPELARLEPSLSSSFIEQLVLTLKHSNDDIAQTGLKLSLHLGAFGNKTLWTAATNHLSWLIKDRKSLTTTSSTKALLLAEVSYPWITQIITNHQQLTSDLLMSTNNPNHVIN